MDQLLRLSALALCAAVAALVLRRHSPDLALLLTLLGCVLGAGLLLSLAKPLYAFVRRLAALTGRSEELLSPLFKCVGIGLLTQLSSALCLDAGETSLSKLVELGGSLLCTLAALPLLEEVLRLIEGLIA